MEEERSGRQAAEAERAAIAEEAAGKAAAATVVAEEAAAVQASLAARLAAAEADLADTRGKLADARTDAEKKLREHWETSRCVFFLLFTVNTSENTQWSSLKTCQRPMQAVERFKSCCGLAPST